MSIYKNLRLALVRPLPRSFLEALQQHPPSEPIDWQKAYAQHEAYTHILKNEVARVIHVAVAEEHPDCCFIEDTALVVGDDVIITRIGADSRRNESLEVSRAFAKLADDISSLRLHQLTEPATLDGGDVLQMNDQVFIGLSERSNAEALRQVKAILPQRKVSGIPVGAGLHLKSVLSAIDDRTLLAADSPASRRMAEAILAELPAGSRCLWVPDSVAANVLRLNSTLLVQAGYPQSEKIIRPVAEELGLQIRLIDMSELVKADGALTCCSILIGTEEKAPL